MQATSARRKIGGMKLLRVGRGGAASPVQSDDVDVDDTVVDFSNASLYLTGIQTIFSICCCAIVSVLACWLVPEGGVSAVRTLALCTATGALLMRKPLRVGRTRGVRVVFASLQPCVGIYLLALVVEQLVHTCAAATSHTPSWRRVVFHSMSLLMFAAGLLRARSPLRDTDLPFLVAAAALLVIALFPPPSVAFVGPLCQAVTTWEAADRLVRAFCFSTVYCVHVFASTSPSTSAHTETLIVVTRSAAATVWIVGAHPLLLVGTVPQCVLVILSRLRMENLTQMSPIAAVSTGNRIAYNRLPEDDVEQGQPEPPADVYEHQKMLLAQSPYSNDSIISVTKAEEPAPTPPVQEPDLLLPSPLQPQLAAPLTIGPLQFRDISTAQLPAETPKNGHGMTAERMAEIAASLGE